MIQASRNGVKQHPLNHLGATILSALIVDDSFAIRTGIARSLVRQGCRVTTAADGSEGLEAVRSQPFDVVISDVNMPGRGGLWLWERALALRPELRGRFLLISSEPLPEPRSMGLFVESEHFLIKPLSLATLWDEVQSIVQRGEATRSEPQSA